LFGFECSEAIQNLLPVGVIYLVCLQIARIGAEPCVCGYSEVIQNLVRMQSRFSFKVFDAGVSLVSLLLDA
jgi:hypothetical protein